MGLEFFRRILASEKAKERDPLRDFFKFISFIDKQINRLNEAVDNLQPHQQTTVNSEYGLAHISGDESPWGEYAFLVRETVRRVQSYSGVQDARLKGAMAPFIQGYMNSTPLVTLQNLKTAKINLETTFNTLKEFYDSKVENMDQD